MRLVRGEDGIVVTPHSSLDDRNVNDIAVTSSACQLPDAARLVLGHRLDLTAGQQAGQAGLARPTAPSFGDHGGRHHGDDLFGEQADMQRPHTPVVALAAMSAPVS